VVTPTSAEPSTATARGNLRALIVQASKRLLTTSNPLQKWGLSVALRRGRNKAAGGRGPQADRGRLARPARPLEQKRWKRPTTLLTKLDKLATDLGLPALHELGYASKIAFRQQKLEVLRTHP